MRKHDRVLQFENIRQDEPINSRCSVCHRPFIGKPKPRERTDAVLLQMRADFEAHNCNEDASQAAVSVVREAT
jgi:hypothetical protein